VLEGDYGELSGPGPLDLFEVDAAARLRAQLAQTIELIAAIPAPFDRHLRADIPEDDPGRRAVLAAIGALEQQSEQLAAAAAAAGFQVGPPPTS
jgi:hypothetical protein